MPSIKINVAWKDGVTRLAVNKLSVDIRDEATAGEIAMALRALASEVEKNAVA